MFVNSCFFLAAGAERDESGSGRGVVFLCLAVGVPLELQTNKYAPTCGGAHCLDCSPL